MDQKAVHIGYQKARRALGKALDEMHGNYEGSYEGPKIVFTNLRYEPGQCRTPVRHLTLCIGNTQDTHLCMPYLLLSTILKRIESLGLSKIRIFFSLYLVYIKVCLP